MNNSISENITSLNIFNFVGDGLYEGLEWLSANLKRRS